MRSGLKFAFVLTSGIIAMSLLLFAGGAAEDMYSQRTYAAGDLILRADSIMISLWDSDVPDVGDAALFCAKNAILLKEGYTLLLDGVYQENIPATASISEKSIRIAKFSLYRNGEIMKIRKEMKYGTGRLQRQSTAWSILSSGQMIMAA